LKACRFWRETESSARCGKPSANEAQQHFGICIYWAGHPYAGVSGDVISEAAVLSVVESTEFGLLPLKPPVEPGRSPTRSRTRLSMLSRL
jgi:hypothetical protein